MSIHTILSQEIDKIAAKGLELSDNDLWKYYRGEEFFDDLRSFATRIVEEVIKEIDGMSERHRCVNCHTIYAEYVNGCPKCWDKYEKPFKVIPFPINISDIRTKLQKMKG